MQSLDVSTESDGNETSEPVRWVSKAEAARELETSVSTLDRMIRKREIKVVWEGRRVFVRVHRPEYPHDDELIRHAIMREDDLERPVRGLEGSASELERERGRGQGGRIGQQRRIRGVDGGVSRRARRAREDKTIGYQAGPSRRRVVRPASRQHPCGVASFDVGAGRFPVQHWRCFRPIF